jgi:hypothetical protein
MLFLRTLPELYRMVKEWPPFWRVWQKPSEDIPRGCLYGYASQPFGSAMRPQLGLPLEVWYRPRTRVWWRVADDAVVRCETVWCS